MKIKNFKKIALLILGLVVFSCAKDDVVAPPDSTPPPLESSADITAFSFAGLSPAVTGKILGEKINLIVPETTDLTALVATFTTTGASVTVKGANQVSGKTPNNFTQPVTYNVIAQNGITNTYTVTATKKTSASKEITSFSFVGYENVSADIVGENITVSLPEGADVNTLKAVFVTTGSSVKVGATVQESGVTENNFTTPLSYTVTAQDNTTKEYTVSVKVKKQTTKEITSFYFVGYQSFSGVFSEGTTITVELPSGTDITALKAVFVTTGSSVKVGATVQESGVTENNFSSPLTYTVTAQDDTTKEYTVSVKVKKLTTKEITSFYFVGFPDNPGVISGTNITVNLPKGTAITNLVAIFTTTGKSVKIVSAPQASGVTENNFTTPLSYTVTAEDDATQVYIVTVIAPPKSSDKKITSFSLPTLFYPDIVINESAHTITVTVKTGETLTGLKALFSTTGTSVKIGSTPQVSGVTENNFTSPLTYTVTAEDNSTQNYTVTTSPTDTKYVTIPDANFRAYLKDTGVPAAFGTGANADKLNIYSPDVATKTYIDCSNLSISDLTGIEYFVGLTILNCQENRIKTLDLSKNPNLGGLYCYDNLIESLDISSQISNLDTYSVFNFTALYGATYDATDKPLGPLKELKINDTEKDRYVATFIKTNSPSCIISTYTTSSIVNDKTCPNYDPLKSTNKCSN